MAELLAPAGDLEKLRFAITYGADAVYLGGKAFSMRAKAGNFTLEEMIQGVEFAHQKNKKVYVTINIAARNQDISEIKPYVQELQRIGVDGIIAADPGVILTIKETVPDMFLSLSTQASTTNAKSLQFWNQVGVDRVILARELGIEDIKTICEQKPDKMQVEMFVHGAMCISYSGRCLLSNYFTGRDANKGDCAQPCRWQYSLVEQTRPGEYFPITEDERGTYIFNSKDLCLIHYLHELLRIGVDSFKIEGRMKSIFYVSTVINAYRNVLNEYASNPDFYEFDSYWIEELKKVSHRQYTEGFYFQNADCHSQNYGTSSYTRNYDFIAQGVGYDKLRGLSQVRQRNKFYTGDTVEILSPDKKVTITQIKRILDDKGMLMENAPHPDQVLYLDLGNVKLTAYDLIRKKIK